MTWLFKQEAEAELVITISNDHEVVKADLYNQKKSLI